MEIENMCHPGHCTGKNFWNLHYL